MMRTGLIAGTCIALMLAGLAPIRQAAGSTMITSNILQRTHHIRWNTSTGTAFTIEHESRQYLITARHLVEGISSGASIQIFHGNTWKDLGVQVVGIGAGGADVAVLASPIQLSPTHPLQPSSKDIFYGQPVFFLGYPYGWDSGGEQINRGIPIPFVKAGILSAIVPGDLSLFVLDAHGNPGFSGGPVVFAPVGKGNNELRVAGIVSKGPRVELPIVDSKGRMILDNAGKPLAGVRENTGFVVVIDIKHAIDLIEANPIGFELAGDEGSK